MLRNIFKAFISIIFSSVFIASSCFAAAFQVTNIGSLNLEGKNYKEWWYTGLNPTFSGVGKANSEVSIKVGETLSKTVAGSDGKWSYSTSLPSGDHNLIFSQGSDQISFVLHLGQNLPQGIASGSEVKQSTVPVTGFNQTTAIGVGVGILLLATYFYISGDPRRKSVFEAKMLKEY